MSDEVRNRARITQSILVVPASGRPRTLQARTPAPQHENGQLICARLLKRCIFFLLVSACATLLLAPLFSHAELDEAQLRLLRQYEALPRWENVEGSPAWVNGIKPVYNWKLGMHVVHLEPGDTVTIRIPKDESVRVFHPQRLAQSDLHLALSNGSGLYAPFSAQRSTDGRSLVLAPESSIPLLARITRPAGQREAIDVAIFLSRRETVGTIAPYRGLIPLPTQNVKIRHKGEATARTFWRLDPQSPVTVTVRGPARLALENRLIYPPTEARGRQTYIVRARLDKIALPLLEFETGAEPRQPLAIDGRIQVVSRQEVGYVNIPEGMHTLQLETTAPLYARVLRQEQPDYLFPGLNDPTASAAQGQKGVPAATRDSSWALSEDEIRARTTARTDDITAVEQAARRVTRDNSYREGGLVGSILLRQAAANRPDAPQIRAAADEFLRFHTFYRDVLPSVKLTPEPQEFAWFSTRRLLEPGEQDRSPVASEQQVRELLDELASGYFTTVPSSGATQVKTGSPPQQHRYRLPARSAPSFLRVVVDTTALTAEQDFLLQFDEQPLMRLQVIPSPELPPPEYTPALAEAGLTILQRQHQEFDRGTLGGPFSARHTPARLLRVHTFEFPLPPTVHLVKIWKPHAAAHTLRVALQYRAARPYRLSESAYLELERRLPTGETAYRQFVKALTGKETERSDATFAMRELRNHWTPFIRALKARHRTFTASTAPQSDPPLSSTPSLQPRIAEWRAQARREEAAGQWLAALETWSRILHGSTGAQHQEAQFARITALQRLGENFLAEWLLRGILLYAADETLQAQAFARLREDYARSGDTEALESLYATAVVRHPRPELLRALTEVLLDNGEHEFALLLGLVTPETAQPVEALLRAAYELGWWQVFDRLLNRLKTEEERNYWRGQRARERGDYPAALKHFRQAGGWGQELAALLERGFAIHVALADPKQRDRALLAWEDWQSQQPGPYIWRAEPQLVTDYATAEALYAIDRDLYSLFFTTSASRPVKLRVLGPLRLRVEVRPIHLSDATAPIDGWLQVREANQLRVLPITNNFPARGLLLVGDNSRVPGGRVTGEYSFGPGLHEIDLSSGEIPLLIRIFAHRPEIPLGVLPPLTPETLVAALQERKDSGGPEDASCWRGARVMIVSQTQATPSTTPVCRALSSTTPPVPLQSSESVNVLLARLAPLRDSSTTVQSRDTLEARYLAQGNIEAALALATGNRDEDVVRRMTLLLWLTEQHPGQHERALALEEALFAAHPQVPGLHALWTRLSRSSDWAPVTGIESSAGVRYIEMRGWQPESPTIRIRKALLAPIAPEEQILFGTNQGVLTLMNLQPVTLEIRLTMEDIAFLPPLPMPVLLQQSGSAPQKVSLTHSQPQHTLHLRVPAGRHSVRISLTEPVANQFLRVRVFELKAKGERSGSAKLPLVQTVERSYQVATPQEPVRISVAGPTWLRIDELREGKALTRYQLVESGLQRITLTPQPGQREALLRVYQRVQVTDRTVASARPPGVASEPVPEPLVRVPSPESPAEVAIADQYPLGGQEDGTWTFTAAGRRRKNVEVDEDRDAQRKPEQFFEASATHRYFSERWKTYFATAMLGRLREHGGSTLGLSEQLEYRLPLPLILQLEGSMYLQQPQGDSLDDTLEWAGLLRGSVAQRRDLSLKTFHLPSLSLFGRALSMQRNTHYKSGHVDQDIFTPYKADHQTGLEIADTFTHRPWLDTLWSTRISLVSNEDYNVFQPDHVGVRFGWQQLLGDVQVGTTYRLTQFLSDGDRDSTFRRNTLAMDVIWERWRFRLQRFELGFRWVHDFEAGDDFGLLAVSWHFGNGRLYRDFRPGEVDFADVRERRALRKPE